MLIDPTGDRWRVIAAPRGLEQQRTTLPIQLVSGGDLYHRLP